MVDKHIVYIFAKCFNLETLQMYEKFYNYIHMEKEKKIVVDFRVKKVLLKLGSYPTIRRALSGEADTPQKIAIRAEAIILGGVIQEPKIQQSEESNNAASNCTPLI